MITLDSCGLAIGPYKLAPQFRSEEGGYSFYFGVGLAQGVPIEYWTGLSQGDCGAYGPLHPQGQ